MTTKKKRIDREAVFVLPPASSTSDPSSIYDRDVVAPDELSISGGMRNEREIAAWWANVRLYTKAMHSLDRAVLIKYVADEDTFYLSSVPDVL